MEVMLSFFFSDFVSDIYFVNKNKVFFLFKEPIFLFKDCEVNDDKKEIESSSPKVSLKKKEIIKNMVFKELFSFHLMDFLKKDLEVYHLSWYLFNLRISLFWLW